MPDQLGVLSWTWWGYNHSEPIIILKLYIFTRVFATSKLWISANIYNKKLFNRYFSSILYKSEKRPLPFEGVHLIEIPENYLWKGYFVLKLLDACVSCLHFLGTHYDYFFRRGFESVRVKFLSGNIYEN